MDITPEMLRASKNAHEMLWLFDFRVQDDNREPVWFETEPLAPFDFVGTRGSGCVYALIGPQRHVLLVTSEGQAAVIAANLTECIALLVAYPYWNEMADRAEGDLSAMRRIFRDERAAFEQEAIDHHPELEYYRSVLTAEFGVTEPEDPAGLLHHAITVLGANVIVRGLDSYPCAPLFGQFKRGPKGAA